MKFSSLRRIKALVDQLNNRQYAGNNEFLFPQMFVDGKWACCIKLEAYPDNEVITPFVQVLNEEGCSWWFGVINGKVAIHIQ